MGDGHTGLAGRLARFGAVSLLSCALLTTVSTLLPADVRAQTPPSGQNPAPFGEADANGGNHGVLPPGIDADTGLDGTDGGGAAEIDGSPDRDRTLRALMRRLAQVWPLRVVSWHLDAASAAGAVDIQPTPQRIWRHTFGAERRPASRANFDVATLDADVVLLQGVRLLSHARLLFPARDWRVLVSRQIIRPVLAPPGAGPGWGDEARTATTAIAVRYQRGVRIAGQEQITDIVVPSMDRSESGGPTETAAALAVRLRVADEVVWLVSADLARECRAAPSAPADVQSAAACQGLMQWFRARRPGERVVIGGPHAATALLSAGANRGDVCRDQMVAVLDTGPGADAGVRALPSPGTLTHARRVPAAGCLARLDLAAHPPAP